MSLTTITFDELRKRSNRNLERAEEKPETTELMRNEKRERVAHLLGKRAHIEDLASTQNQRTAYAADLEDMRSHHTYVMLRNISEHPQTNLYDEKLRRMIWNALPNCMFKRFQELFCHEHHLVVPPFEIGPQHSVIFRTSFMRLPLNMCLVSPDLIRDDFAQNVGLCSFAEEDTPLERLEKKRAAIPKLKQMFSSAQALLGKHYRFLVLRDPQRSDAEQHDASIAGGLLYVRNSTSGSDNGTKKPHIEPLHRKTVAYFASAYGALRKPTHQTENHDRELLELTRLEIEAEDLHRRCRFWKRETPPEQKERIKHTAHDVLNHAEVTLDHCTNAYKQQALEQLAGAKILLDKGNVSAAMTRLLSALRSLQKRLIVIHPISGYNEQDRRMIMRKLAGEELTMRKYRGNLAAAAALLQSGASLPHSLQELDIDPAAFASITMQPMATFARSMTKKQWRLEEALRKRDAVRAREAAVKIHIIGKLQGLRSCIETVKLTLASNRAVPVEDIASLIAQFSGYFSQRQILPEITIPRYEEVFRELEEILAKIQNGLQHYVEQRLDLEPREEMYERLKTYLDSIDIEKMVRTLP